VAPGPDPQPVHRRLGLADDELSAIVDLLGRAPSDLELAMFAVMWSEHCSYKSSSVHLARLPTTAPWVLVGPGEGAGVVDVGDGVAVAVRIESHNHPSAVEPFQGAATGVGGIIRDVFSMGARPIALMDPLRFGPLDDPRTRYLFEGVVSGISGYGNAVGVPTVGGEAVFDPCYRDNPLVNVMCLGVMRAEDVVLARAEGDGNLAVLLGSATGRDGIGGASVLASAGFDETTAEKRPAVQVGDPFEEKKLIEACLELVRDGLIVGVQDLGAAGISCAASETAAKAGMGMDVDVARVHRREPGMSAVEVMTSESQERMLAVVRPAELPAVLARCERWEIRASVIGRVTTSGRFRVYDGLFDAEAAGTPPAAPLADVPAASLGDGPVYRRPLAPPPRSDPPDPAAVLEARFPEGSDLGRELLAVLATPTVADKSWVWSQYDHQLFLNTVVGPGGDAAVLRLKDFGGTPRALALATDGTARFCRLDPRTGGRLVVLEAARNVAAAGARALALVNCLNFGNPEHPEVMWQFSEVIDGMAEACTALGIPVIGGNVSFYNESRGADIDPTPIVAVVGVIDPFDGAPLPGVALPGPGLRLLLLGETRAELGGSEWAAVVHGLAGGLPPQADLAGAAALHGLVADLVRERAVAAVHDCSDGGLAVALAEMAMAGGVGLRVERLPRGLVPSTALFSESASRVVVAVPPDGAAAATAAARAAGVAVLELGGSGGTELVVDGVAAIPVAELTEVWQGAIPKLLAV
jgi:phosphoribosylformylglycinamidine synthase